MGEDQPAPRGRLARGSESDLTRSASLPTLPSAPPFALVMPEPDGELLHGERVGEYCIDSVLGRGGFGAVYRASHPVIGKVVAIKVLARQFAVDPMIMSRFVDEARAVNQIRHRNIIDIFSFGQLPDGRLFYVMELLDGETLDRRIARGPVPLGEALPILRGIARALDAAHAAGITHRDLKAENVFLANTEEGTLAKLFDFGIAKLLHRDEPIPKHKTRTGSPLGTVLYMSPEQTRGKNVDHRTDYYAFGVLAYRMLAGRFPLDGDDYLGILMKQVYETAPPASHHVRGLPTHVDRTLAWLMQKEPANRPPSLRVAVRALEGASRADSEGFEIPSAECVLPRGVRITPQIPKRVVAVAVACGLAAGIGGLAGVEHLRDREPVPDASAELAAVWGPDQKRAIQAAFLATEKPYAAASYRSVERAFDQYANAWVAMKSEPGAEQRTECLLWRLEGLRARAALFAKADAAVVERAVDIAGALPDLAGCAAPTARVLADPAVRAKLGELRKQLAMAHTLEGLAKYKDAIAIVEPLTVQATQLGDRPFEADACFALGELQALAGDLAASAKSFDRAIVAATAGRHDEVVARASIRLAYVIGVEQARYDEGRTLMHHAKAAIERLGGNRRLEGMLAISTSVLLRKQGHYEESLAESSRAIVLGEAEFGPTHPTLGRWINSHGLTLVERGDYADARSYLERARVIAERERGEHHPNVGFGYGNLGLERYRSGEFRQAIVLGRRALAILEPALGAKSPRLVSSLVLVADAYIELREFDEARVEIERAIGILAGANQTRTPTYASAIASLAQIQLETGRPAKALPLLDDAIRILEAAKNSDPMLLSSVRFLLARTRHAAGDPRRARALVPAIRAGFVAAGAKGTEDLAKLDAWLAQLERGR